MHITRSDSGKKFRPFKKPHTHKHNLGSRISLTSNLINETNDLAIMIYYTDGFMTRLKHKLQNHFEFYQFFAQSSGRTETEMNTEAARTRRIQLKDSEKQKK